MAFKFNRLYDYPKIDEVHWLVVNDTMNIGEEKLPSVTTILIRMPVGREESKSCCMEG
jgi:hypothetical protein